MCCALAFNWKLRKAVVEFGFGKLRGKKLCGDMTQIGN
jgi:hypothetical protein